MSLQTLHPTTFDEGVILDQTPPPGVDVPENCDYSRLLKIMLPLGAEMLVKAIRNRLYLPPYRSVKAAQKAAEGDVKPHFAPKIETLDRLLCFQTMDSSRISRLSRAFESTWAFAAVSTKMPGLKRQRIIFSGPLHCLSPELVDKENENAPEVPPGLPYKPRNSNNNLERSTDLPLLINTIDGKTILVPSMKVEGGSEMPAYRAALKHKLIGQPQSSNSKTLSTFHHILTSRP